MVSPKSNDRCPYERKAGDIGEIQTQRRRPCDDRGRNDWSNESTSQGASGSQQKPESHRKDSPRGRAACCHLDFRFLAHRTVRQYIFAASSVMACGALLSSPRIPVVGRRVLKIEIKPGHSPACHPPMAPASLGIKPKLLTESCPFVFPIPLPPSSLHGFTLLISPMLLIGTEFGPASRPLHWLCPYHGWADRAPPSLRSSGCLLREAFPHQLVYLQPTGLAHPRLPVPSVDGYRCPKQFLNAFDAEGSLRIPERMARPTPRATNLTVVPSLSVRRCCLETRLTWLRGLLLTQRGQG